MALLLSVDTLNKPLLSPLIIADFLHWSIETGDQTWGSVGAVTAQVLRSQAGILAVPDPGPGWTRG